MTTRKGLTGIVSIILLLAITIGLTSVLFYSVNQYDFTSNGGVTNPTVSYNPATDDYTLLKNPDDVPVGVGSTDNNLNKTFASIGDSLTATDAVLAKTDDSLIIIRDESDNSNTNNIIAQTPAFTDFSEPSLSSPDNPGQIHSTMDGSGTSSDPYVIKNDTQLQSVQHDNDEYYKLGQNIDASNTRDWNDGNGFTPYRFEGVLDGNGYAIKDSYSQRVSVLFTNNFGNIKNLSVINATVSKPSSKVGVIAKIHKGGVISNVYVSGNVTGDDCVGGFVAVNGDSAGSSSIIRKSYANVNVTGNTNVGGLAGCHNEGQITNSFSVGNVTGDINVGGAIGVKASASIEDVYWDEVSSGQSSSGSGVTSTTGFDTDSDGDGRADEMIGDNVIENMTWLDFESVWKPVPNGYPVLRENPNPSGTLISRIHSSMDGSGTSSDPYIIKNDTQLQSVKHDNDEYYKLGQDIDASNTRNWKSGAGFTPYRFEGVLDGNGYAIKDSYSQRVSVLFTNNFGNIKNMSVINTTVAKPSSKVGVIAKIHKGGVISNVYASGNVTGDDCVGGLVAVNGDSAGSSSIIRKSYANVNVTGNTNVGGLAGCHNEGQITNSFSVGNVTGDSNVGGAIGVKGSEGSIEDVYWDEIASGQSSSGTGVTSTTGFNTDSDNDGRADEMIGNNVIENMTWLDFESVWKPVPNGYPVLRENPNPPGTLISRIHSSMSGDGTQSNPFVITNDTQLQSVKHDSDKYYRLGQDIDASNTRNWKSGRGFTPYRFEGVLDGNGHAIKDLYAHRVSVLFTNNFGNIKNLSVTNATVSRPSNKVGVIAKIHKQGVISNVYASGEVTGDDCVGGLVAVNGDSAGSSSTIRKSYANVNVAGDNNVGGLAGCHNEGQIENSFSVGNVTGNSNVGGAIGVKGSEGSIEDVYWDEIASGQSSSGTGVTSTTGFNTDSDGDGRSDEMIGSSASSNMTGFDFTSVWKTVPDDYPELRD